MTMPPIKPVAAGNVSLVDAVDHLLDRGAVLHGDATLSVADVDLVYVGINLLISSVETMRRRGDWPEENQQVRRLGPRPPSGEDAQPAASPLADVSGAISEADAGLGGSGLSLQQASPPLFELLRPDSGERSNVSAERSIVRLVLALVELLRQLVERQALRRVEGDGLSEEQIERMGQALKGLSEKMGELRVLFGLSEQDLAIDLGPLGRLI
jgi:gas vesicle protein GvpK/gas vesicle protein GvpA/GvpJ/GvpM family